MALYINFKVHLDIIVWELFTNPSQVGHHGSLLHGSVHLEDIVELLAEIIIDDDGDNGDGGTGKSLLHGGVNLERKIESQLKSMMVMFEYLNFEKKIW